MFSIILISSLPSHWLVIFMCPLIGSLEAFRLSLVLFTLARPSGIRTHRVIGYLYDCTFCIAIMNMAREMCKPLYGLVYKPLCGLPLCGLPLCGLYLRVPSVIVAMLVLYCILYLLGSST